MTGPPLGEPVLDEALATVAEKPRSAQDLVNRLGKGPRDQLLERLVGRRPGRAARGPRCSGSSRAPPGRRATPGTRRRCEPASRACWCSGSRPDPRTAALVALLAAIDHAHKVVDRGDVPAREVKARAKEISEGAWAAKAVKDAVAAAQAAVTAAVTASIASTTAASGGQ